MPKNTGVTIVGAQDGGDTIKGSPRGHDVLIARGWNNLILSHLGADTIYAGSGSATVEGGFGAKTIFLSGYHNLVITRDPTITGSLGDTMIVVGNVASSISTGGYANMIHGGDGRDTVQAGAGADTVVLGSGDDRVQLGGWNNAVTLGGGANSVSGSQGGTAIVAGDGNSTLIAGGYANLLRVGNGDNRVDAGAGHSTVIAGTGHDSINLGGWNNTVSLGGGAATIVAGLGADQISMSGGTLDLIGGQDEQVAVGAGFAAAIVDQAAGLTVHLGIGGTLSASDDGAGGTTVALNGPGGVLVATVDLIGMSSASAALAMVRIG